MAETWEALSVRVVRMSADYAVGQAYFSGDWPPLCGGLFLLECGDLSPFAEFGRGHAARKAQFFRVCTISRSSLTSAESVLIVALRMARRNTWTM